MGKKLFAGHAEIWCSWAIRKAKGFYSRKHNRKRGLQQFIGSLDIPSDAKHELLQLTPETYIGLTPKLAKSI